MFKTATKSEIFRYSLGGLGSNLPFYMMMTYLTYFYTDIYGIKSAFVVANILLIARFFDALTAILFGFLTDRTRTKLGRYRPWIIFGSPILAFLVLAVFIVPDFSYDAKIIYAYLSYIAYSALSDGVNIPYQSLTPVISQDPKQRTLVVTAKQGAGVVAQLLIMVFALPIIDFFGGGAQGWTKFGVLIAIMTMISFWICSTSAKRNDVIAPTDEKNEKIKLRDQFQLIFKNRPLLMLLIAFCSSILSTAITSSINIYYFKYVLGNEGLIPTSSLIIIVGTALSLFTLPIIAGKIGKKNTFLVFAILGSIPFALMLLMPKMNLIPLLILFGLTSYCQGITGNIGWALVPEAVDYAEWKFGIQGNATITSSVIFVNKLGMALGGFIGSIILGIGGFVANAQQTPLVLNMIVFMRFGIPILAFIISIIAMKNFEIDEEKAKMMRTEITLRENLKLKEVH